MQKLELKKCSHGRGVFAKASIKAGEVILRFKGPVVGIEDLPRPYTTENDYYLQIGENLFMGPSDGIDDYVNHSCEPNSGIKFSTVAVELFAIKRIAAEDQITFDYSTTMHKFPLEMKCYCGFQQCRRKIKNFVDLPAGIQSKYIRLGILPSYILGMLNQGP